MDGVATEHASCRVHDARIWNTHCRGWFMALSTSLAKLQGVYFVATGVWPLLHMRSFTAITGPKLEPWLVKTVGLLVTSVGGGLLASSRKATVPREVAWIAATSAAALAAVDIVYAAKRRISPVYLLDALLELALVAGWTIALAPGGHEEPAPAPESVPPPA